MSKEKIQNKYRLAAIFASWTILITGAISLFESMSLDYYSVLATLQKVIPASFVMGVLGWMTGALLDKPRRRRQVFHNNLFIKDVIKKETEEQSPVDTGLIE